MENQLQVIVKDSGLDKTKADYILEQFQDYFKIASEWEVKAKTIVVTDESQEVDMEMARTGRLFLREKRIKIENARKTLKEQSLREGKAIDGIANVLKALIVPIDEYLEKQEKFVEIQEEKKRELIRIEVEKKMEEERIAKEKAEAEERDRIRVENERLRKEQAELEAKYLAEKKKAEAERKQQEEAMRKEREESDRQRKEAEANAKEEHDRIQKEAKAKLDAEREAFEKKRKAEQDKAFAEAEKIRKANEAKLSKERAEREKLEEELRSQVTCPHCKKKFKLGAK